MAKKMTRDEALSFVKNNPEICIENYVNRAKDVGGQPSYECPNPACSNGAHDSRTGITGKKGKDGIYYHCFSCEFTGDIIDIIQLRLGCNFKEATQEAFRAYGLDIDVSSRQPYRTKKSMEQTKTEKKVMSPEEENGIIREIEDKKKHLSETTYMQDRGISLQNAMTHGIGYDNAKKSIFIPVTQYDDLKPSYTTRSIETKRYGFRPGGSVGIFNYKALSNGQPVFVVEGAMDALSVSEVGGNAVALNSTSNAGAFLKMLVNHGQDIHASHYFICMDNDDPGRNATKLLKDGLTELRISNSTIELTEGILDTKDANDALIKDRERLKANVEKAIESIRQPEKAEEVQTTQPEQPNPIEKKINSHKVNSLFAKLSEEAMRNEKPYKTGFCQFDEIIGDGLFPRLYIIGAVPGIGKSTFAIQVADNVAKSGHDVLYFSIEMPCSDIMAKSISRETYIGSEKNIDLSMTESDVLCSYRHANLSEKQKEMFDIAMRTYMKYASDRISIYEGALTVEEIRSTVEEYITFTGKKPLVIVDYIQILQPSESTKRATIREQVDHNIAVLASIRRDLRIPVIGISSLSRQGYDSTDAKSFKESSTIEYSADVAITIDLADKEQDEYGMHKEMDKPIRNIVMKFLKNRGNQPNKIIKFSYRTQFNYFEEVPKIER